MRNLAAGADDIVLCLLDDAVGGVGILEPDNGRLSLIDSESAGDDGESGGDK